MIKIFLPLNMMATIIKTNKIEQEIMTIIFLLHIFKMIITLNDEINWMKIVGF